jgi:hypothetical protein
VNSVHDWIPFFSIYWNGSLNIAFQMRTPHLLKVDAEDRFEKLFQAGYESTDDDALSSELCSWLGVQVVKGSLTFDQVLGRWRYCL